MKKLRVGAVLLLIAAGPAAYAMPAFMSSFRDNYKVAKDSNLYKANCTVCHVKGAVLNDYGKDLQKAMKDANAKAITPEILKAVEKLDSDKDGVTNIDEIKADTLPGDNKSTPPKK